MSKLIFLCARRAGMSHAAYAEHLLERHAPLALRHLVGLRRYTLNVVETAIADAEPIDSVNALGYDSLAAYETQAYDSPAGERAVVDDVPLFLGAAAGYVTRESVHLADAGRAAQGARSPGVKWICALRRTARISREAFAARLESDVVPELLAGQPGVSQLSIDHVERRLYDSGADWDAFIETHFADDARAPLHPFDSFNCGVSLRGRISRLTDATAIWRIGEYVLRE